MKICMLKTTAAEFRAIYLCGVLQIDKVCGRVQLFSPAEQLSLSFACLKHLLSSNNLGPTAVVPENKLAPARCTAYVRLHVEDLHYCKSPYINSRCFLCTHTFRCYVYTKHAHDQHVPPSCHAPITPSLNAAISFIDCPKLGKPLVRAAVISKPMYALLASILLMPT